MRHIKSFTILVCTLFIASCTGFREANQKVAEWAGKMIEIRDGKRSSVTTTHVEQISFNNYTKDLSSKNHIDNIFVKLKRNLNLKTIEAIPNVYYKLEKAEVDPRFYPKYFTTQIILEKDGGKTRVHWELYSTEDYAKDQEKRLLKSIR